MRPLWLVLVVGCTGPTDPSGAYPVEPPAATAAALTLVRACAAAVPSVRPFATLRFYAVPGSEFSADGLARLSGYERGGRIYLAAAHLDAELLIAHELLHALKGLPGRSIDDHPAAFWRCGLDPRQF